MKGVKIFSLIFWLLILFVLNPFVIFFTTLIISNAATYTFNQDTQNLLPYIFLTTTINVITFELYTKRKIINSDDYKMAKNQIKKEIDKLKNYL
jgi:cytochrome b subunit of formate dehydrogenase